jgi:internalin A
MNYQELLNLIAKARDEEWQNLDLSGWGLDALPPEIGSLVKLKRLILGKYDSVRSQLIGNNLTDLPEELGLLKELEILLISGNQLTSIPKPIEQLTNLQELDLRGNAIKSTPEFLGQLINLYELDLSENQIVIIPESIRRLRKLTNL